MDDILNKTIIDWDLALEKANGNDALAKHMMNMLLEMLPEHERFIDEAFNAKNYSAINQEAHKLYGALCYCGTPNLKKAAKALENASADDQSKEVTALYQKIKAEIAWLKEEAKKLEL